MQKEKLLNAAGELKKLLRYPETIVFSAAMYLSDVPGFVPNDLDVMIDARDFKRLFPNASLTRTDNGVFQSYLEKIHLCGVRIDVMAAPSTVKRINRHQEIVVPFHLGTKRGYARHGNQVFSLITPTEQIRLYKALQRPLDSEKMDKIAKHIGETAYDWRLGRRAHRNSS